MIKEDCFACYEGECTVLVETQCEKCKFYKNRKDIDFDKIDEDLKNYNYDNTRKVNNKAYISRTIKKLKKKGVLDEC